MIEIRYRVNFLTPLRWTPKGKTLEDAVKSYKSKTWAEKFYEKKRPLSYRLKKIEKTPIGSMDTQVFEGTATKVKNSEIIKEEEIPESALEDYYLSTNAKKIVKHLRK